MTGAAGSGMERIAVVTGASRGLGRVLVERLASMAGFRVVATARDVTALAPLVEAGRGMVESQALDVTDDTSVAAFRDWIAQRHGRVDVLVNNAGVSLESFAARLAEMPLDVLRRTLETNLFGVLRVTQALLPLVQASQAGRIVMFSSGLGQLAEMEAGTPAYRISKTALNAVTRILAAETAGTAIKVNALCPGWCRTDMGGEDAPRSPEEGIDTAVWLATLPADGPSGGFFRDRAPIPW